MTLHLLRLAAGVHSLDHLREILATQKQKAQALGLPASFFETRSIPRRRTELLQGGSLYRVVKGEILARQLILGIEDLEIEGERPVARVILAEPLILLQPRPQRPFQGWRYLKPEDAPQDLTTSEGENDPDAMPLAMRQELERLGLL